MPRLTRIRSLSGIVAILLVTTARLAAVEFTLESRAVSIPENGFFTNLIVHAARYDISLLPPAQWKLSIDTNTASLTWKSPDFRSIVRLKLVAAPAEAAKLTKESLRERMAADSPGITVRDEFECYTASHPGLAIEVEVRKSQFPAVTRFAIIPHAAGAIEVEFTCPLEDYESTRHRLGWMMNSLRILPR